MSKKRYRGLHTPNGKATEILTGDVIMWDRSALSVIICRNGEPLRAGSLSDNKIYTPFICDEQGFKYFLLVLLRDILGLDFKFVEVSGHHPAVEIIESY